MVAGVHWGPVGVAWGAVIGSLLNIPVIENDAGDSSYPCGTGLYTYAADHQSLTVAADHPDAGKAPVEAAKGTDA